MIRAYIFVRSNACDSHRFFYGDFNSVEEAEKSFTEDYPETTIREGDYFWEYSLELEEHSKYPILHINKTLLGYIKNR